MNGLSRDGLVLELLCNGSAEDTSGHGRHGVVHGAVPTADRFGNSTGALLFDGTDDYVVIAAPPLLSDQHLSVSIWARIDTVDLGYWSNCLICQDDGNDEDQSRRVFQLSLDCGRIVWHRMVRSRDPRSRKVVTLGAWHHVAAVFERGEHRLYVDAELHDTVHHTLWVHPGEPIHIGRKGTPERCFFFHGALDDVRVFNRAIDPTEVRALFGEGGYRRPMRAIGPDPITGGWETDAGNRLDLRFDGQRAVTGALPFGSPRNLATVRRGTFDPSTNALRLEGEARRPDSGTVVPYVIEGTLDGDRLAVTYQIGDDQGRVALRRITWSRALRRRVRTSGHWLARRIEPVVRPLIVPIDRWRRARLRPSKATNVRNLRERGETIDSLVFRDAVPEDVPALAELHVKTWAATYPGVRRPPTFAIREWQWREAFANADGSWFCIVIENAKRELVGFAKGNIGSHGSGDLNKIYLLWEYHRMGLGRRLVGHVVRRFMASGITRMTLSADEANPSCAFYLALGAENPRGDDGRLERGNFVWRDLETLASICPVEAPGPAPGRSPIT